MEAKTKMSEKLLRDFEVRMTDAQDMQRGIPAARITAFESTRRNLEQALFEKDEEIKRIIEKGNRVFTGSSDEMEAMDFSGFRIRPLPEEIRSILIDRIKCDCNCCVRDFQLPFINGTAAANFNTESPVNQVEQGIVGWGDHSNPPPKITNTGSGSGQLINGNLNLWWRTNVPHDGIFAMRPNQNRSSFAVFGSHKVRGRGWYFSGNDARAEVHAWVIVYLDNQWLEARHVVVSSDATRSENRTRSFGRWVNLPGRITFQAQQGQELGMIVRLYGETWANDEGLAEINIDLFGVPSNGLSDMHIDVMD